MTAPAQKNRILQNRMNLALRQKEVDRNRARIARRLDPVVHGILEQRLQHQWRNESITRHALHIPVNDQSITEPQLLEIEVLSAQQYFVLERRQVAVVAHQDAKQLGQILERRLGALRLTGKDREHRIYTVA